MYWVLSNELVDEDNDADLSGVLSSNKGLVVEFNEGVPITVPVGPFTFTVSEPIQGNLTDHLSITEVRGLVFSTAVLQILDTLGVKNIQTYDLTIVDTKGKRTITDYKIVNVADAIDCIDHDQSDLEYFDSGNVMFIDQLQLDESKIPPELHIFRVNRSLTTVVISDKLKKAIEAQKLTGFVIYKPEEYS